MGQSDGAVYGAVSLVAHGIPAGATAHGGPAGGAGLPWTAEVGSEGHGIASGRIAGHVEAGVGGYPPVAYGGNPAEGPEDLPAGRPG